MTFRDFFFIGYSCKIRLLQTNLTVPLEEPVTLVGQILLDLTTHSTAVGLTATGINLICKELSGIRLTVGKAHDVVEAGALEGQLQTVLVEQQTVNEFLLPLGQFWCILLVDK